MQTGSSGTLIGWKSGLTTYVPLRDRMEGAWLWTQLQIKLIKLIEKTATGPIQVLFVSMQRGTA
jgi:hypothetical protein